MTCAVDTCDKPAKTRGWCSAHYTRWKKHGDVQADKPLRARFDITAQLLPKIQKDVETGHWYWTGHINKETGYGVVNIGGTPTGAHRAVWEHLVGPIPAGHEPDHACRVRHCVNVLDPAHLEVVTHAENTRRAKAINPATHCARNHAFTEANTYHRPSGGRTCRTCKNASSRAAYRHTRETAA